MCQNPFPVLKHLEAHIKFYSIFLSVVECKKCQNQEYGFTGQIRNKGREGLIHRPSQPSPDSVAEPTFPGDDSLQ